MAEIKKLKDLQNTEYGIEKVFSEAEDFLPLLGTDYVELYVGNAKQSAHFYKTAFGFQSHAYAGLETGLKDRVSYVLKQGKIKLVLTTPLNKDGAINEHINKHGDGVKIIALWVDDATKSFEETTKRGAKAFMDTGPFLPGYKKWESHYNPETVGLKFIDHMVGNVGWGDMNTWCKFYAEVMGFAQIISFTDNDISTNYTALMSKVMSNGNGRVKFPINEPAKGMKKSQIEEYLDFYGSPGVLKQNGILIDRDEEGYLLQLFTKPIVDRPTLFLEVIQRKGAQSFGVGNFKSLFEAIEREQSKRGTL